MAALGDRIARELRRERDRAGLSAAELARRAGVSKATVSQLEAGTANPNVETLWAIATALGVPFSAFVDEPTSGTVLIRSGESSGVFAAGAPYEAMLLSAGAPRARRDLYLLRAEPGAARDSAPHSPGTTEHVVLMTGSARVTTNEESVELAPGDYFSYPGDAPHSFEALEAGTSAVLVSELG